jgi:hypothetical protein
VVKTYSGGGGRGESGESFVDVLLFPLLYLFVEQDLLGEEGGRGRGGGRGGRKERRGEGREEGKRREREEEGMEGRGGERRRVRREEKRKGWAGEGGGGEKEVVPYQEGFLYNTRSMHPLGQACSVLS